MNILITSAGRRVSLVRFFIAELRKLNSSYKVFTTDLKPKLSSACNVSDGFFEVPKVTDSNYIDKLLSICQENNVKIIVPTIDTELQVLSNNVNLFKNLGISVIVSNPAFVNMCRDKRLINLFFVKNGIRIPEQYTKENFKLPMFIKPYDGSLSSDTFLITEKSQLTSYHFENNKLMFMEYIDKNIFDEYTVDMYYGKDNKLKMLVPRKRIEVRSGEINKGITKQNYIVNYLKNKLKFIEGAIGCLTTQVFFNEVSNEIIAIEINPRFGGGYPLSYHAGANYPSNLINEYLLNQNIEYSDNWETDLLMLRYDDEILISGFKN